MANQPACRNLSGDLLYDHSARPQRWSQIPITPNQPCHLWLLWMFITTKRVTVSLVQGREERETGPWVAGVPGEHLQGVTRTGSEDWTQNHTLGVSGNKVKGTNTLVDLNYLR